jgi:hypothetical protein
MAFLRVIPGSGLAQIRSRLAAAKSGLASGIPGALTQLGGDCVAALGSAAPHGSGEGDGANPPGDASGALADSFVSSMEGGDGFGQVLVRTTQPTKLRYVRYGTGVYGPTGEPIHPTTKRALFWKGAEHPVRQVRGQPANDFVTPVVNEYVQEGDARMDELAIRIADLLNGSGSGL